MKLALALAVQGLALSAFASTPLTLDSRGPVSFSSSSVDCSANQLTVMRRFRAESYQVRPDLCAAIQSSAQVYNLIGFDDQGVVALIGYEAQGSQKIITSN